MNKTVERAYELNKLQNEKGGWSGHINWDCAALPDLEIGEVCAISDVWDGEGEEPELEYSYYVTESGEDGEMHVDIWINYVWEVLQEKEEFLETVIKIKEIKLI